jgi:hypothetical protein
MEREQDRVERVITEMAKGKDMGDKLGYDRRTKTFRLKSKVDPDACTEVTPEDNIFYSGG